MNNSSIDDSNRSGEYSPLLLEGPDIRLREFAPEDLDDFCAVAAEPHIREFLPDWHVAKETRRIWLRDYEIPGSREFLEAAARDGQVEEKMLRLAVIERSSGRFVGWCCTGIKDELPPPNREIVYGLSAACRGRGYMTQAASLLADWLFAHTDIEVINGLARPANTASNRVLQKCGFETLGERRSKDGLFLHYALKRPSDGTPDRKRLPDTIRQPQTENESPSELLHQEELYLQTATAKDAEDLRALMVGVEADETRRWYENGERPYIPGFDSLSMQIYQMQGGLYDKIMLGDRLVGVALVSTTRREHGRIDRLYLAPSAQNPGIGSQALKLIERKYPQVTEWSLDTIKRSPRNLRFYEKNGYARTGEDDEEVYYAKNVIPGDNPRPTASRFENRSFARADFRRCDAVPAFDRCRRTSGGIRAGRGAASGSPSLRTLLRTLGASDESDLTQPSRAAFPAARVIVIREDSRHYAGREQRPSFGRRREAGFPIR